MNYPVEWNRNNRGVLIFQGVGLIAAINPHIKTETFVVVVRDAKTLQVVNAAKNVPDESTAKTIGASMIVNALQS